VKNFFLFLFAVVALMVLLVNTGMFTSLYVGLKPLIMISLLGYYWVSMPAGQRSLVLMVAMFFSWVGDVLLMFSGAGFFLAGLGGFLVAHIFYVMAYRQHKRTEGDGLHGVQKVRYAFPVILAGTGLLVILMPVLGDMTIPVALYAAVLVVMVLTALFRFGHTNLRSFWMVFAGATLFMISDSTIAINKFLQPIPQSGLLIMSTYMAAQWLIVEGLIRHQE
jgi:uncharacterized membrane protein YhhN